MKITNKIINSFLALCASAALGAGAVYLYYRDEIKTGKNFALIDECQDILDEVDYPLTAKDSETAVLNGYLSTFGDKYTYYRKTEYDGEYYTSAVNVYTSLISTGYQVGVSEDGRLEIISVDKGSPAEKQGLKTGDIIVRADSHNFDEEGLNENVLDLAGKEGTHMALTIERDGTLLNIDLVRSNDESLQVNDVEMKNYGNILYIKVRKFDEYTNAEFEGAILEADDFDSVIIDMRGNGGGEIPGAVSLADRFIGEANVDLNYYTGKVDTCRTSASDGDISAKTVILCNENTASAAEIFTALLKQYGNATLVGTNTFGKGIFQHDKLLSNGGVLHYTAGYYTVGEWECYQGKGIAPDVEIPMNSDLIGTEDDIQLEKALELLG